MMASGLRQGTDLREMNSLKRQDRGDSDSDSDSEIVDRGWWKTTGHNIRTEIGRSLPLTAGQSKKKLSSYVKTHYDVLGKLVGKWPKSLDDKQKAKIEKEIVIEVQPKGIVNGTMKSYQLTGLAYMQNMAMNGAGCILGDEMVCVCVD
jgi:SNF2 family DNA or RNA helicase